MLKSKKKKIKKMTTSFEFENIDFSVYVKN